MREELTVGLDDRSYPIIIGDGILEGLGNALSSVEFPRRVALVTNPTVGALYGARVETALRLCGYAVLTVTVPDGEEFKNQKTLEEIYNTLIAEGFDRFSGLVALGGGVIGDLTGFAAATYMRGIPFAQVPTTLLAQVDSSVGGKTGINHPLGKNLIGAFYQPRLVLADVTVLSTLPAREFSAGMAEVVKYGIIRDRSFFDWLRLNVRLLTARDPSALTMAVKKSCQIKANVVELDEKESSLRAILNYGHTFGHAVETLAGYGEIKHGEAVAIGMTVACRLSLESGLCSMAEAKAIEDLLVAFGLPVSPPDYPLSDYLRVMSRDKKAKGGLLRFILNRNIGDCLITDIPDAENLLRTALTRRL